MHIVDVGSGPPVVLIPGIQGRWEWMRPAVDALASHCRVVTFSLADEPSCGGEFDAASGFACYVDQVVRAMDAAGLERAVICGVSYGGLIAAAFAAQHPERVSGLALVSAIPPSWTPDARVRFYLRAPRLLAPLFCVGSLRLYPEIAAAAGSRAAALRAAARHGLNALRHMMSPARMARRVHLVTRARLDTLPFGAVQVPTLVMTGTDGLDRVVPVALTGEYSRMWPHAETVTLERTGHLGLITRPERFAEALGDFAAGVARVDRQRRRIG